MNDILAITADRQSDDVIVSELAGSRADRVTVLLPGCRPESDPEAADRLTELVTRVQLTTGAAVTGLAGDPSMIDHADYDDVVHAAAPSEPSLLTRLGIKLERSGARRGPTRLSPHGAGA
jgi:hypothetical protein